MNNKRLFRSRKNSVIAGVCGGLGNYLDIDPTIVRILFVIGMFTIGFGVLAYIVAVLIMPLEPVSLNGNGDDQFDYTVNEGDYKHYNSPPSSGNARLIIGLFLILAGGISIAEKVFGWFDFDLIWPVAIIGIGALILMRERKH